MEPSYLYPTSPTCVTAVSRSSVLDVVVTRWPTPPGGRLRLLHRFMLWGIHPMTSIGRSLQTSWCRYREEQTASYGVPSLRLGLDTNLCGADLS